MSKIAQDIKYNRGNLKGLLFILFFRISHFFLNGGLVLKILGSPFRILYNFFFRWIIGIDIPDKTELGAGFMVFHGQGLIIHGDCVLGNNVLVRHNTTIGQRNDNSGVPTIGNNVNIGAHCIILGEVSIGDNSIIGAGTFVNKNIPPNSIAYGSPLKVMPNDYSNSLTNPHPKVFIP